MSPLQTRSILMIGALLLGPPLMLPLALALNWLDAPAATSALVGCAIAAVGGLLTGTVAERLLHRGEGSTQQLLGVVLTSVLGVLTIGYLYLVHLRGPMTAITTPERIVSQTLVFLAFLAAQAAGILAAMSDAHRD
jgi:hypothetical protein